MTSHCLSGYVPTRQSKEVVPPPEPRRNITLYTKEQLRISQSIQLHQEQNFQKYLLQTFTASSSQTSDPTFNISKRASCTCVFFGLNLPAGH